MAGFALAFLASLGMGRFLTPAEFGVVAVVATWAFYARLVRPGLLSAAGRDMPHLLGEGRSADAKRLQDIAITGESVFALVVAAGLVGVGFAYRLPLLRLGLWLTGISFAILAVQGIFTSLLYVHQRFSILARFNAITVVVLQGGILAALPAIGVYAPLTLPVLAGCVSLVLVFRHRRVIDYVPTWTLREARAMARVGLPLTAMNVVSWAYFMSDRPAMLAAGMSLTAIGLYSFATNIIRGLAQVFWDFSNVLQPVLWREFGRDSVGATTEAITRVWLPYTAVACFAATASQAGFGAAVHVVAPSFTASIAPFEVLTLLWVIYNATQLPNLVLNSRAVGRQTLSLAIWSGGLVLNLLAIYAVARSRGSLVEIAVASMSVDAAVALVGYAAMARHLGSRHSIIRLYGGVLALTAVTLAALAAFELPAFSYTSKALWAALVLRLSLAVVVWSAVGLVLWRWLRPRRAQDGPGSANSG